MGRRSLFHRLCSCTITFATLAAAGFGLWAILDKPTKEEIRAGFGNVLGNFTDFIEGFYEDPYLGSNDTDIWNNGRRGEGGLYLTIENALEDAWQEEFNAALNDWENGNSLVLERKRVAADPTCQQKTGVMKVCNGNYGATGWLGINELLLRGGFIFSSVAMMNDYYLSSADYVERQYTMCHEVGHGFGLPHTDENFYNEDLGNCMDYTNNPRANLHPGAINYARLVSLYGTVTDRRRRLKGGGGLYNVTTEIPRLAELEQELSTMNNGSERLKWHGAQWRLLSAHPRGQRFSRKLGNEFKIQVNVILVP
jgi:hypothetical protein